MSEWKTVSDNKQKKLYDHILVGRICTPDKTAKIVFLGQPARQADFLQADFACRLSLSMNDLHLLVQKSFFFTQ